MLRVFVNGRSLGARPIKRPLQEVGMSTSKGTIYCIASQDRTLKYYASLINFTVLL